MLMIMVIGLTVLAHSSPYKEALSQHVQVSDNLTLHVPTSSILQPFSACDLISNYKTYQYAPLSRDITGSFDAGIHMRTVVALCLAQTSL